MADSAGSDTEIFKRQVVEHEVHIQAINEDRRDLWSAIGEQRKAISSLRSQFALMQGAAIGANAIITYFLVHRS